MLSPSSSLSFSPGSDISAAPPSLPPRSPVIGGVPYRHNRRSRPRSHSFLAPRRTSPSSSPSPAASTVSLSSLSPPSLVPSMESSWHPILSAPLEQDVGNALLSVISSHAGSALARTRGTKVIQAIILTERERDGLPSSSSSFLSGRELYRAVVLNEEWRRMSDRLRDFGFSLDVPLNQLTNDDWCTLQGVVLEMSGAHLSPRGSPDESVGGSPREVWQHSGQSVDCDEDLWADEPEEYDEEMASTLIVDDGEPEQRDYPSQV